MTTLDSPNASAEFSMRYLGTSTAILTLVVALGCGAADAPPASPPARGSAALADAAVTHAPTDWPNRRGPTANLIAPDSADPPVEWSATKNILWKAPLTGRGHASPIVVGDRVVIATADEAANTQSLHCFSRADGKPLWSTVAHRAELTRMHRKNSHASPTPISDGQHVYAVFINSDGIHATKLDLADGSIVWNKRLGDFTSEHGYGASPVFHRSAIIVSGEDKQGGFLTAIDRDTGDTVWTAPRKSPGTHGNYASPAVGVVAGRPQLVMHGFEHTAAFDPDTGKELWRVKGPTEVCANTPTLGKDTVYVAGGYPRKKLLAITPGTNDAKIKWSDGKGVAYVTSMILHNDRLYVVDDKGIASLYNAATGESIWRKRLDGDFSGSPVLVGDRIYVSDEAGKTHVLAASDTFKQLATNTLPGSIMSTPAVTGDRLIIRTADALYGIGID